LKELIVASVFIIAEAGVNHNGSLARAMELIDVAADAGADAVKFQTFRSEAVISGLAPKAEYQLTTTGGEESQLEMVRRLELDHAAHRQLRDHCGKRGILFLSTPFDAGSADFLVKDLAMPQIKIPSGELTNAPFLLHLACFGLPVILSTGMSTLGEVEDALGVLAFGMGAVTGSSPGRTAFRQAFLSTQGQMLLRERVTLLHCTTEYPAPFAEVNLRAMDTLSAAFGLKVGFSDHTTGIVIPLAAVARGACVVEKHFTLDRNLPGPDHLASLEPAELVDMVAGIRQVESALGNGRKTPAPSEVKNIAIARRSLVAETAMNIGDIWSMKTLSCKRPGTGRSPFDYWSLLGQEVRRAYKADELIDDDE
jgi:N-acetylneuraminate synthase